MDEYRRLLYVALTRAEIGLVLCGADGLRKRPEGCWYNLVRNALEPESEPRPATGFEGEILRWRAGRREHPDMIAAPSSVPTERETLGEEREAAQRLGIPPVEVAARRNLRPSSSMALANEQALARGEVLHRLLAGLAPLAPIERPSGGRRLLAGASILPAEKGEQLLTEALQVLEMPELSALFAPGSLAEVPLAGVLGADTASGALGVSGAVSGISGRIDRLAVEGDRVLFADFKTDRHVPRRMADVPEAHRRQVVLYAALLRKMFPAKEIEALLVYTAGPVLHRLDDAVLKAAWESNTST